MDTKLMAICHFPHTHSTHGPPLHELQNVVLGFSVWKSLGTIYRILWLCVESLNFFFYFFLSPHVKRYKLIDKIRILTFFSFVGGRFKKKKKKEFWLKMMKCLYIMSARVNSHYSSIQLFTKTLANWKRIAISGI